MSVYKCDYPDCGFSTNWYQSLKRHKKNVHAPDRLPNDLPIEKYPRMPKAKRSNYEDRLVQLPKLQQYRKPFNDSLTEYKLHEDEIRDKNGKSFLLVMSLIALVFAIVYFRRSIVEFIKQWQAEKAASEAAKANVVNQADVERNEIGRSMVQIIPRTSQNHDLNDREPVHE